MVDVFARVAQAYKLLLKHSDEVDPLAYGTAVWACAHVNYRTGDMWEVMLGALPRVAGKLNAWGCSNVLWACAHVGATKE